MDRRRFLLQLAGLAASARCASALGVGSLPSVVHAPCGALKGFTQGGCRVFRGVPFATPPVGPLRFRAPEPMQPWAGMRDATQFAAAAVQPEAPNVNQSEDCLYLNVWAPENAASLPVFVWVHGGGFTGGYSFDPLFDGSVFAQNGMVCVTIAYRLGVLGFLDASALLDSSYAGSANNGLRDIIMALQWVQQNVAAFGGDAARVTVGGESAGAKLIDLLMGTPAAEHLFHQMISQSGGADRIWPLPRAQEIARAFGKQWTDSDRSLAQLRNAPAKNLIAEQAHFMRSYPVHYPIRAEVDGVLIKQSPLQTIREGSTRGKRLLLGTNRDESASFLGSHAVSEPSALDLGNLSVDEFRPVENRYRQVYPDFDTKMLHIRSVTAEEYWVPSIRVAQAHVADGGEAFVYRLDFSEDGGPFPGMAFHSYDLRFVWEHFGEAKPSADALALAHTMHAAWVSFIKGSAPTADNLPKWPVYRLENQATMLLNSTCHVASGPQAKELELWNGKLMQ